MPSTSRTWLSDDEQRAWRVYLEATQLLFDSVETQLSQDADLSHADYEVFVRLSEAPGRQLRMSELADRTLYSRSRLSHAVARLEAAGWVERAPCPGDRRGTLCRLTSDGFAKLKSAAPGHARTVRRLMFDHLNSADVAALERIATVVRDACADAKWTNRTPSLHD